MKKIKLLIPALSIASVGAVVTPMVTSCSKAFMTITDPNFVGEVHEAVSGGLTEAQATELLFKNGRYLVEDFATNWVSTFIALKKQGVIENDQVNSLNVRFNTLSISSEKVVNDIHGFLLSGSIDAQINASYDVKLSSDVTLEKQHQVIDGSVSYTFDNCFAYVKHVDQESGAQLAYRGWGIYLIGMSDASANWSMSESSDDVITTTYTYDDGSTKVETNRTHDHKDCSAKAKDDDTYVLGSIYNSTAYGQFVPSNYLSNIAKKG